MKHVCKMPLKMNFRDTGYYDPFLQHFNMSKMPSRWGKPRSSSNLLFRLPILPLPCSCVNANTLFLFPSLMKAEQIWDCQMTNTIYENSSGGVAQWIVNNNFSSHCNDFCVAEDDFLMEYWTVSRSTCCANKCNLLSVSVNLSLGLCWYSSFRQQYNFFSSLFLNVLLQWLLT